MKVTIVPAQVTTIEDRIAGRLGLSQLLLLVTPIFGGSALYSILPPAMHSATYKIVAVTILTCVCSVLAIRVRGKLLLFWLVVLLTYHRRPRHWVCNKNSLSSRELYEQSKVPVTEAEAEEQRGIRTSFAPQLSFAERAHAQAILEDPAASVTFTTKKGELYAFVTEIKN